MKHAIYLLLACCCISFLKAQTNLDRSEVETGVRDGIEVVLHQNKPYTGSVSEDYPNGRPKSWISYKDGLAEGPWQEWYGNGNLKFSAHWKAGKGHGLWEYFHENGTLRQEEFYDMDIPIGIFRDYYPSGQLKAQSSWLNGAKEGRWTYYSADGMPTKTERFQNGVLVETFD